jgi:hypothetical protein
MKARRGVLAVLLSTLIVLPVAPANAEAGGDPVTDLVDGLLSCTVDPDTPYFTTMVGAPTGLLKGIEGYASVSGCHPDGILMVCLDHFAVTWHNSCMTYGIGADGSAGGPSAQAPCIPGIWQTSVTVLVPGPDPEGLHSDSLTVTTECLGRS